MIATWKYNKLFITKMFKSNTFYIKKITMPGKDKKQEIFYPLVIFATTNDYI